MKNLIICSLFILSSTLMASEKANNNLLSAIEKGSYRKVVKAINAGADVNAVDIKGFAAISRAVEGNHISIVNLLIENKVNLEARTPVRGLTPLLKAAHDKNVEMVKLLVLNNADVNATSSVGFRTPLIFAALEGSERKLEAIKIAEVLLNEPETDLNIRGGMCALMVAARQGNIEIVDLILEKRIEKKLEVKCLSDAANVARINNRIELAEKLEMILQNN